MPSAWSSDQPTEVIRPGRPRVRVAYQLAATLHPSDGAAASDVLAGARQVVLEWCQGKFPASLPPAAFAGESFRCEEPGQSLGAVWIPERGAWSMRLLQPDSPRLGPDSTPPIAGRTWTQEIALAEQDGLVHLAICITCATLPFADTTMPRLRPGVVSTLAEQFDLRDVRRLTVAPWIVADDDALAELHALVVHPRRQMSVFVASEAARDDDAPEAERFGFDPAAFMPRLRGYVALALLPGDAVDAWAARIGREWHVPANAVRQYRPAFDALLDLPSRHPLLTADRAPALRERGAAREAFLLEEARLSASSRNCDFGPCLLYADALRLDAELRRARAKDDDEWRSIYESELESLRTDRDFWEGTAGALEADTNSLGEEVDRLKRQVHGLQAANRRLQAQLDEGGSLAADDDAVPESFDAMAEWVETRLAGRLILHPRAIRSLRAAEYEQPSLAGRALLLLAREYRDMKLGVEGGLERWESARDALCLRCQPSISDSRAGEEGEEYKIEYPIGSRRKRMLDLHLKKGNSHEPRYCLRVYFFWDDDGQVVVVGDLPHHLDTRQT